MVQDTSLNPPQPEETLSHYVRRLRTHHNLSQSQLSQAAGIHRQTVGKVENGQTQRLSQRARKSLAFALSIPIDYLNALCQGIPVTVITRLKFCPQCWVPGTTPEPMWTDPRSHYCFDCGTKLLHQCVQCKEPFVSLQFRFCPHCGSPYKPSKDTSLNNAR